jgi:site-specific recombinase XerD
MKLSKRRQKAGGEPVVEQPKKVSLSFEKALTLFLEAQNAAHHSKVTLEDYQRVVGAFLRYMRDAHGYMTVDQITEGDIFGWLSFLRDRGSRLGKPYSSRTIETYSRDVRVFLRWLMLHKHLEANPMELIRSPKVEKALIRVFTEEELKRLDAACDRDPHGKSLTLDERKALAARDRAFLWLLLSTGIRMSEACGLLFSDIDWDKGMIYVRGKGAKERRIPMGKVARQHAHTYIEYWRGGPAEPDDHVFLTAFGTPMKSLVGRQMFARLKRVAGITDKRVSAHTCRHWFAVNCIKNGMPTIVLKELLGHEQWEMIEVYVRLAEQDTRLVYDRFSPVDSLMMHHSAKGRREQAREWRKARKKGASR